MAKLKALTISRKMQPGRYGDGGGLYLLIGPTGGKSWVFRWKAGGKEWIMGLGPFEAVTLAEARQKAEDCRRLRAAGKNPLSERGVERARIAQEAARAISFKECAEGFIRANEVAWTSAKNRLAWRSTLDTYIYPVIGKLPAATIDRPLVMKVLQQEVSPTAAQDGRKILRGGFFWLARPHTADRVRGRIEAVLDWAKVHGYRDGENPARWKGNISYALPSRSKATKTRHHPALPFVQMAGFMADLRQETVSSLALQFCILNATRIGETLNARMTEIDERTGIWTIPAARMKAKRDHRIPLSTEARAILERVKLHNRGGEYIFPGNLPKRPLWSGTALSVLDRMKYVDSKGQRITTHGFRRVFGIGRQSARGFRARLLKWR